MNLKKPHPHPHPPLEGEGVLFFKGGDTPSKKI
jgi:hypothetical protein